MSAAGRPDLFSPERTAFLVGCARSGTSIFGEVIGAHPDIEYLFEISSIWNGVFTDREDDRLGREEARNRAAVERLHREIAGRLERPGARIVLEKNPKHALRVGFLGEAFPGSRILHIIRDGRDVVASLMFRNRGRSWGHLKIPGWQELLERHPEANHIRCAHQWNDSVRLAREEGFALGEERYLEVLYEDFVSQPTRVAAGVFEFLGLYSHSDVEAMAARVQDETAGSYHARKQVRHYVENHSRRIGRYLENLSPAQLEEVEAVCGDLLDELGYRD